ncbi:MAG TPA: hypothetical protein VFT64_07625 [Rickettsiales bacterium]|nr:hypothetical protein [Rickettsiales bacterium]
MADNGTSLGQDLTLDNVQQMVAQAHSFVQLNDPAALTTTVTVLPQGQPVIVDGFAFLNFTGTAGTQPQEWPPSDLSKFEQMAQVLKKLESKIASAEGTGSQPFNRVVHVKRMPAGNGRGYGMDPRPLLGMDYGETAHPQSDVELDAILAHEYAHQLYGDGKHNLDDVKSFLTSQPNGYLKTYSEAPDAEVNKLERLPDVAKASILGNVQRSVEQYKQYITELYDYLQRSPSFGVSAEDILYGMETGDDTQREYFAGIDKGLLSRMHNNALGNMVGGVPVPLAEAQIPHTVDEIRSFMDSQLAQIQAMQPLANAMLSAVQAINYAQENRADRFMARIADDPSAAKYFMHESVPEDRKYGTDSHPPIADRSSNIDNAVAGRVVDEAAMTGGFVDELSGERRNGAFAGSYVGGDGDGAIHPVRSPASLRGTREVLSMHAFTTASTAIGNVSGPESRTSGQVAEPDSTQNRTR